MKDDFQYATKTDVVIVATILAVTFVVLLLTGCQTGASQSPPPDEPEVVEPAEPVAPEPQEPEETPEEVFVKEFDACWAAWKECLKTQPDSYCFPIHEACAVTAYRKLKKARGQ